MRGERYLKYVVVAVLGIALVALLAGPLRGAREDIGVTRGNTTLQLDVARDQLRVAEEQLATALEQLETARAQLAIATEQRDIALRQLEIAEKQYAVALEQRDIARRQLEISERLLVVAEATLAETREINRKTPDLAADGQ